MSIFLRYSPVPIVLSQAYEKAGQRDNNGDLKIINFPNQWGDFTTSFATSGFLAIAASSGIVLNTPGYVNVSGLQVNTLYSQQYGKIDMSGNIIPLYSGMNSGIMYKKDDNNLQATPAYEYNTDFDKLVLKDASASKLLYVGIGYDRSHTDSISSPTKELDTYDYITLTPTQTIDGITTESHVEINAGLVNIASDIIIGPEYDGFSGRVLTHMGSGNPALWKEPSFLPEGMSLNRYSKRPIYIKNDRIIFYATKPSWGRDGNDGPITLETLRTEFGLLDTIEVRDEQGNRKYIKLADATTFVTFDPPWDRNQDGNAEWEDIVTNVTFTDPIDDEQYQGFSILICPLNPFENNYDGIGFAFSVKKGSYIEMSLEETEDAKARFSCEGDPENSPFTFRPSTTNTISTRPNVHTAFNKLAEDIDFVIYGKKTINYDNYDPTLFDLTDSLLPTGLIPYFKIDAYIPNAAKGHPASGVYFTKYLDRDKLVPSGFIYDEESKVIINGNSPYIIASLPKSGEPLNTYANLTVSGSMYSDHILAKEIYLRPQPSPSGNSEYVANSVLILDSSGKIISKKPKVNPIRPSAPLNVRGVLIHNSDGQAHSEASIEWDAPSNNGGADIIGYIVQFSANNGNEWTTLPTNTIGIKNALSTQRSATITNLSISTQYIFRVAAQNSVGISNYSDSSEIFYSNTDVPVSPQNFESTRSFDETLISEINLSWEAGHQGSATISGYLIEESIDSGNNWLYYNSPSNLITGFYETITGTTSSQNYLYRISSWNSYGQSAYSYVFVSGNIVPEMDETEQLEQLSNWDFGKVLFTGVCT